MNGMRFDRLTRTVEGAPDRRTALKVVGGALLALAPVGAGRALAATEAEGRGDDCPNLERKCRRYVQNFCASRYDGAQQRLCTRRFGGCCEKANKCQTAPINRCFRERGDG